MSIRKTVSDAKSSNFLFIVSPPLKEAKEFGNDRSLARINGNEQADQ